ncbi:MAG: hypothetical protein LAT82_01065 [Nanoarchaeota archaeon]|nr:hypothetical protein [Nanoarchaeota archaeon]
MIFLKSIFLNFKLVFFNWKYTLFFILLNIGIIYFFTTQTADELIKVNYGVFYYNIMWTFQILISVLFSLFVVLSVFKLYYFSNSSVTQSGIGSFGSMLGVLVAGCPACSITIASYLGLATMISFFPYDGLELKLISIIILLIVNFYLLKNLQVCKIKKSKK